MTLGRTLLHGGQRSRTLILSETRTGWVGVGKTHRGEHRCELPGIIFSYVLLSCLSIYKYGSLPVSRIRRSGSHTPKLNWVGPQLDQNDDDTNWKSHDGPSLRGPY